MRLVAHMLYPQKFSTGASSAALWRLLAKKRQEYLAAAVDSEFSSNPVVQEQIQRSMAVKALTR